MYLLFSRRYEVRAYSRRMTLVNSTPPGRVTRSWLMYATCGNYFIVFIFCVIASFVSQLRSWFGLELCMNVTGNVKPESAWPMRAFSGQKQSHLTLQPCDRMQSHAIACNCVQSHAIALCTVSAACAIACNRVRSHAIAPDTCL